VSLCSVDHVHYSRCHVTFRIHSTLARAKFDTVFSCITTLANILGEAVWSHTTLLMYTRVAVYGGLLKFTHSLLKEDTLEGALKA